MTQGMHKVGSMFVSERAAAWLEQRSKYEGFGTVGQFAARAILARTENILPDDVRRELIAYTHGKPASVSGRLTRAEVGRIAEDAAAKAVAAYIAAQAEAAK